MNANQSFMLLRIALTAGGTVAATKGIDMTQYNIVSGSILTIVGALTTCVPIVWGWFVHKTPNTDNVAASK